MKKEFINNISQHKILILLASVALLYAVLWFTPLIRAYTKYPVYYAICGGNPIAASDVKGKSYVAPGDKAYFISMSREHYFCSEQAAQDAGYAKSR